MTAKDSLEASAGFFEKGVVSEGGTFKVVNVETSGSSATGTINASIKDTSVTGYYNVTIEEKFVTLKAYYAPTQDMSVERATLEQILGCYERDLVLQEDTVLKIKEIEKVEKSTPSGFTEHKGK